MAFENFFAAKLYNNIGASDNEITLTAAPTSISGRMVLEARNPTQREIIKYTGVSGNKLTGVTRGQGGTSAKPHSKNALVEMNLTAEDLEDAINVPNDIVTRFKEALSDFIADGTGIIPTSANLTTTFSDIVYYIDGHRYTKTSIGSHLYTASQDTYVSIDTNGNVTYTPVANGTDQPSLPASSIWVAKVVTDSSKINKVELLSRGSVASHNIDFASLTNNPNSAFYDTGWSAITPNAAYTGNLKARRIGKLVMLDGQLGKSGNIADGNTPVSTGALGEFTPSEEQILIAIGAGSVIMKLRVRVNGMIDIAASPSGNTSYLRFDGLSYFID